MPTSELRHHPAGKPIHLFNATCVYCGTAFGDASTWTKEHVIGRRFVPRGTLDGHWNLIVRACSGCNNTKADLENDLSAITMQPDAIGRHACDDPRLLTEAVRRAEGSYSRRTGRKVKDSADEVTLTVPVLHTGVTATFTFRSAPSGRN